MAILQLRYHTHDPSSPRLANQRLNWRYLSNILQKKRCALLEQIYQIGTKMLNSKFFKFEDMDPTKKIIRVHNTYICLTSQLPTCDLSVSNAGLEKCWSRASLWNNKRNLSLYKAAFAEASPWMGRLPVCLGSIQRIT
jgi:hypothetical protein